MPTRKIDPDALRGAEIVIPACKHPDHTPKTEGLEPGMYEHTCPACSAYTMFPVFANYRKG